MTSIDEFITTPCPKIDAWDVAAYFELGLDPIDTATLKLDTSWGCTAVDLTPAVKVAETITHLFITPEGSLQFNREDYGREGVEDGGVDCITGNELSRIISMQLLKDVDQTQKVKDGMVYMWDGIANLFEPYDLKAFVNQTNDTLESHGAAIDTLQSSVASIQNTLALLTKRVSNLETRLTKLEDRVTTVESDLNSLKGRVSAIEGAIYNWGTDKSTPLARGTINVYGGTENAVDKGRGIYTHNPNNNVTGDQYFA